MNIKKLKLQAACDEKLGVSWTEIKNAILMADKELLVSGTNPGEEADIHALLRRVCANLPHGTLIKQTYQKLMEA